MDRDAFGSVCVTGVPTGFRTAVDHYGFRGFESICKVFVVEEGVSESSSPDLTAGVNYIKIPEAFTKEGNGKADVSLAASARISRADLKIRHNIRQNIEEN